jgi:hypothetical protein
VIIIDPSANQLLPPTSYARRATLTDFKTLSSFLGTSAESVYLAMTQMHKPNVVDKKCKKHFYECCRAWLWAMPDGAAHAC